MSYNEIYLMILGAAALVIASLILLTVNKTSKLRYSVNKRQKKQ